MTLEDLKNKKIAVLGFGIENQALVNFLVAKKISCEITICDAHEETQSAFAPLLPKNIKWRTGVGYDNGLMGFDLISRVAGYPLFSAPLKMARQKSVKITSPADLFLNFCPSKNIIGVTGTKGKGTTASLIFSILKQAGKRVFLGGNIGIPMFSFIKKVRPDDWVVLELSSFQLEDIETSPKISVITNFYKEHLAPADPNNPNYHKTLPAYWQAKANIFKWQSPDGNLIINEKLKAKIKKAEFKGATTFFSTSNLPSNLIGAHNQENIAAALTATMIAGVPKEVAEVAIKKFKGLEHRLELVAKIDGVKYYDDSFSTTPENTIVALKSFSEPVILLAGGADKGSNFKSLAKIIKSRVKFIVLFSGVATPRLEKEIKLAKYPLGQIKTVTSMADAIKFAKSQATPGDIVLLSPGCASFGLFKNYKERGDLFKEEARKS